MYWYITLYFLKGLLDGFILIYTKHQICQIKRVISKENKMLPSESLTLLYWVTCILFFFFCKWLPNVWMTTHCVGNILHSIKLQIISREMFLTKPKVTRGSFTLYEIDAKENTEISNTIKGNRIDFNRNVTKIIEKYKLRMNV